MPSFKITHCISSIDISSGGPARSVTDLIIQMAANDNIDHIELYSLLTLNPILNSFLNPKINMTLIKAQIKTWSFKLNSNLMNSNTNLFHGHGLWQMPVHQMSLTAQKRKIPYVISTRGMLEPWSLEQSKWKKFLAMKMYQENDLNKSACIHATSNLEAINIRNLGFKAPIAIIPNGINLNKYTINKTPKLNQKIKTILFLSRIHPKKGLEILINAWELIPKQYKIHWQIEIIGDGDKTYIENLTKLIETKDLIGQINFKGPLYGTEKINKYKDADIFVLPTFSENS
ncbi:MAG: glycosyltransferase [Lewinellaceae bacterium]|nr:glycosyltransferase [Lewinellaceae bacterium]